MNDLNTAMLENLQSELFKFLDTLTGNELNQLELISPELVAKIYQAGAVFSIEVGAKLARENHE